MIRHASSALAVVFIAGLVACGEEPAAPVAEVPAEGAPMPAQPAPGQNTPQTDIEREYTLLDAVSDANGIHRMAILRALDKVTGRAIDLYAPAGIPIDYGTLTITVQHCYTVPPEEPPETNAFLQIDNREGGVGEPMRIFSGWMFASTPALHALEHPVYDVWVITCRTDAPPPAPPVPEVVSEPLPEDETLAVPDGDVAPFDAADVPLFDPNAPADPAAPVTPSNE
jgi:hypothetical protein